MQYNTPISLTPARSPYWAFLPVVLALLLFSPDAAAQRTAKGSMAVGLSAVSAPADGWGGRLTYNAYNLPGIWDGSLEVCHLSPGITTMSVIPATEEGKEDETVYGNAKASCLRYTVQGGYLARLVANRSRSVSLYGGGGAILGVGSFTCAEDGWAWINSRYDKKFDATESTHSYFMYGVYAKLEFEWFFAPTVAADLTLLAPLTFSDSAFRKITGLCRPEVSLGIKVNF